MDVFIKAAAGIFIAVILGLTLAKQGKDISLLLTVVVCCMVVTAAVTYLEPVIDFLERLQSIGQLNTEMFAILMKAAGIGLLTELMSLICTDAGNASLGKTLQILASAVILWMSIPMLNALVDLIDNILGAI